MEIYRSSEFTSRLLGAFGSEARAWLDDLPRTVDRYVRRWELQDLTPVEEPSYGWVAFCDSPWGPAVLKLSFPNPEAVTEVLALRRFPATVATAVIADDREAGAVLLERLMPGTRLRLTRDFDERVEVASQVFAALHGNSVGLGDRVTDGPDSSSQQVGARLPSYFDQADRAYRNATELAPLRLDAATQANAIAMIDAGRRALDELRSAADPPGEDVALQLLHGDLHHDNILQSGDDWKLIDPKGVRGPLCLEPARFIGNQLGDAEPQARCRQFDRMCEVFAAVLSRPYRGATRGPLPIDSLPMDSPPADPRTVAVAALLDATVSTCWGIEEEPCDWAVDGIDRALEIADWVSL